MYVVYTTNHLDYSSVEIGRYKKLKDAVHFAEKKDKEINCVYDEVYIYVVEEKMVWDNCTKIIKE